MLQYKDHIELISQTISALAVLIGAVWAYFRFRKESPLEPRIEFDFDCQFLGPQQGGYLAVFTPRIYNKGSVEHKFNEIRIRIRALRHDQPIEPFNAQMVAKFPVPRKEESGLLPDGVNLLPEGVPYFFVRPGVTQAFNYVTPIAEDYRFIIVRLSFKYAGHLKEIHTAERVLEVKASARQG